MKKLKVVTVVGTRPEIIRLSRVMARLDEFCDHVLVHTGQNYDYELNQVFFEDLEVRRPAHFLESAGETPAQTIGNVIIGVDRVLAIEKPDALLVLGDTNSCLGVIPAKRRRIPVFHMEAGNRCFDQRVPEEINRRIAGGSVETSSDQSVDPIANEQIVFEADEELRFAGIPLPAGAASQLKVDARALVTIGANHEQSATRDDLKQRIDEPTLPLQQIVLNARLEIQGSSRR